MLEDTPRHMWMWIVLVLSPRAFWRDKVELYVNGVRVADKLVRYPSMKSVTTAFIGGYASDGMNQHHRCSRTSAHVHSRTRTHLHPRLHIHRHTSTHARTDSLF